MAAPDARDLELTEVARLLAEQGGRLALRLQGRSAVTRKADDSPVTDADHAVQELILAELARRFPNDAVLVEERLSGRTVHADRATAEYCWVIDPIDGTRNFARGSPMVSTSVAVLRHGRPVAGAIFDGSSGQSACATRGGGATVAGRRVALVDRPADVDTSVAVSSFRLHPIPPGVRRLLDRVLIRNVGSACIHQVWLAAGYVDGLFAPDTKLWDIAAGALLMEEAGAIVTDVQGRPRWPVNLCEPDATVRDLLAGRPAMHATLLAAAREP
ncbi:MAG: inositol monophosphatase [Phycisphaerae bacterium]